MTTSAPTSVLAVARDEPEEQVSHMRELVGGANVPRLAVADARRALPAAHVVDAAASRRERPVRRGRRYAPRLVPAGR